MPRAGRKATAALAVSLVFLVGFLAAIGAPVGAQDDTNATGGDATAGSPTNATGEGEGTNATGDAEGFVRTVTVGVIETGCPGGRDPCWDISTIPIGTGETVVLVGDWRGHENTHNIHVQIEGDPKTPAEPDAIQSLEFQVPENARTGITFICDVHPRTMIGELLPPAAFAAQGAHEEVPEMGVHFLAYWVGVIAFAILFVVYGITFFLFKYNETSATTDHWDRSGTQSGPSRVGRGAASLLAVVIAVAAIGVIIYLARFR